MQRQQTIADSTPMTILPSVITGPCPFPSNPASSLGPSGMSVSFLVVMPQIAAADSTAAAAGLHTNTCRMHAARNIVLIETLVFAIPIHT